ncbi:beta-1,3-glucan-binding protein-like isoform X1 [Homarus americanus]|uniref:beta-1,3-glucan-binding protein-like isoform X1 n=1 Tax=Homarus americanus TaxID=6706 RepID=UPI001C479B44|nr:beta-1,3-glucan-binding protein-like isoform X1 [Homarus americanus]XP_042221991.1 beta-1,3-glucan-binding protein-like isoform X1 [Homarus americanus]
MILLFLLYLACGVFAADVVDPKDCTAFPCMIFSDDFDYLDHDAWEHEITMSGGGNWEFEVYVNNRSVSYTRNSTLFIKPGLTSEWKSEEFLTSGDLNLWGMNGRGDVCTGNSYYGCNRVGTATNIVNPVTSARLRTLSDFAFRYGRIEIRAKMPSGAWLWPAMWLLPRNWPYGLWPASGEIDIVESRGNSDYGTLGNQYGSTTLHWGPYWQLNMYQKTHTKYQAPTGSYADNFHTWRMDWTKDDMKFYVDDELKLTVDPFTNFWDFGGFGDSYDNPWAAGGKMAPFDQKFYIVLNLAVGGTNGFFPDDVPSNPPKPWSNVSPQALLDFWNGHSSWLPTWEQGEGRISEKAALQVDYVKVWKMENIDQ